MDGLMSGSRSGLSLQDKIGHWLTYFSARALVCVVQSLRWETCQRVADLFAVVMNDILQVRRSVLEENLRHALPELSAGERRRLTRQMWRHLVLMVCEVALAPRRIHDTNWLNYITIPKRQELVELMLLQRPKVAVTAHFGNFEICGFLAGLLGFPSFTIARPLDNPYLHRFLINFRESTGQFILPTKGSAEQAQAVVEAGETLSLLGDHHAGPKGCWVDFLNRPASCHKAVALFSLANQAPLFVLYARRREKPLHFEFSLVDVNDPADTDNPYGTVSELTQWYNQLMEKAIREEPSQYWWLHRRWKDTRGRRKRKGRRRDSGQSASGPHMRTGGAPAIEPGGSGESVEYRRV